MCCRPPLVARLPYRCASPVAFARGTLNAGHDTISSPSHSITWSLDPVGNFSSTTTDGGSAVNNIFNKQNEETAAGFSTLAFDANGNFTTDDHR